MIKTYAYDDVLLIPQYSDIRSRAEINISTNLGPRVELQLPIFASPMDTVSESAMANAMRSHGGSAIVHRYNTIEEQVAEVNKVEFPRVIGAAIGVSGDYLERASALAGNVATLAAINDLADWGATSVRCNIGGGSICSTRIQTGHGLPGLQTIIECAKTDRDVKIIADGGIKNSGDMVKALAAGADAVMVGSLLAGTTETPGEMFMDAKGDRWKTYRGMASKEAQVEWRGKYSSFEGVATRVPHRGPVAMILEDLEKGIRSGFSYTGARTLRQLQAKAQFVSQTTSGLSESHTHINTRAW